MCAPPVTAFRADQLPDYYCRLSSGHCHVWKREHFRTQGIPSMATATATTYEGTFHGRADEVARVRKEIAAYLGECPVADDLVLIADDLASNSILHTKSRGGALPARCVPPSRRARGGARGRV